MPSPNTSTASLRPSAAFWGGFDALDSTSYFTSSGQGIVGTANNIHVQAWIWIESQAVTSATRVFLANAPAAPGNGWRFLTTTTNATLNFALYDSGSSSTKVSAALTLTAGHIGRPLHVCGSYVGGGCVLWVDSVRIGSPTAVGTYGVPVTPRMTVGRRMQDSLNAMGDIQLLGGVAGGPYNVSDADVLAAYNAGRASKNIAHIAGAGGQAWTFKGLGTAPASIPAIVGSETLDKTGTPSFVRQL